MGRFPLPAFFRRVVIVAALAAVALIALPGPASAEAPCWKRLTLDWADNGKVDKTYPIPCYSDAIAHLNSTDRIYSSAEDDIHRALQRAIANENGTGGSTGSTQADRSSSDSGGGVPTPLIVLGGIAILLVAVGAVGLVRRRSRPDEPGTS